VSKEGGSDLRFRLPSVAGTTAACTRQRLFLFYGKRLPNEIDGDDVQI
jgi:hypothetical protein